MIKNYINSKKNLREDIFKLTEFINLIITKEKETY